MYEDLVGPSCVASIKIDYNPQLWILSEQEIVLQISLPHQIPDVS